MTSEQSSALALPEPETFKRDLAAIRQFQEIAHQEMIPNQDYGIIPGTSKPTLLKPGAEKIAKLLGLADLYEIEDRTENWEKPFFRYLVRCRLVKFGTDLDVSQGLGECNSMEAKYRWREMKRKCPSCEAEAIIKGKEQYGGGWLCWKKQGGCGAKFADGDAVIEGQKVGRVENEDIYSLVNTILKMAKKRALVDAALSAGRLSNVFTQDMEDLSEGDQGEPEATRPEERKANTPGKAERVAVHPLASILILRRKFVDAHKAAGLDPQQANDWLKEHLDMPWSKIKDDPDALDKAATLLLKRAKDAEQALEAIEGALQELRAEEDDTAPSE